jgi:glycogen synthase
VNPGDQEKQWKLIVSKTKKIKFAYLSGPVDGVQVYDAWEKEATLEYFGTSYLRQFYQVCRDFGAEGYVITTSPGKYDYQRVGTFIIENRPMSPHLKGLAYHVVHSIWMIKIIPRLLSFGPDVVILTAGPSYWIFLSVLKLFGIVIIPAQHDSLWRRFVALRLSWRILRAFEALFFAGCVKEAIVAAESTAEQIRALVPRKKIQIEVFLPTYQREQFSAIQRADFDRRPFRVLFMGRITPNKGIYDLVKIASQLDPREYHFDICGGGPDLAALRRSVEEHGLAANVVCHGFLDRSELYALINQTHAVIVPTTTDFEEGFNMVCAEAILSGRPVITSAVCPALAYIADAAIEVKPNDVDGYREALVKLATNRDIYEQKRASCSSLQQQFYDTSNSWYTKLYGLLRKHIAIPSA